MPSVLLHSDLLLARIRGCVTSTIFADFNLFLAFNLLTFFSLPLFSSIVQVLPVFKTLL